MSNKNLYIPLFILLALGFTWGTGYSIARFAMTHGVNPLGYSFWQSLGPAILVTLIALLQKEKINFSFPHIKYYFICGLTGIALPNTNMYFASPHLPAGLLAVIVNTVPIMVYLLAIIARVEIFDWVRFAAVCLALTGLMLILTPSINFSAQNALPWMLTTLLTPFCFAFSSVYINKYRPSESTALSLAAGTLIFSSILLLPVILWTHGFYTFHIPLTKPDWIILLEILLSSIGYVLFFKLIRIAGAVYYSFVDTIVTLTGLFWGYLIFNERLNLGTSIAILCIIFSLILVTKKQRTRNI